MKERFVSGACAGAYSLSPSLTCFTKHLKSHAAALHCSLLAGAISQVLIYPFEIVKTRIVVARKDEVSTSRCTHAIRAYGGSAQLSVTKADGYAI